MSLASGWEVGHYVSMLGNQTILILWIHTLVMSGTSSMDSPLVHELVSSQWYGRRKSNLNSTAKVRLTP